MTHLPSGETVGYAMFALFVAVPKVVLGCDPAPTSLRGLRSIGLADGSKSITQSDESFAFLAQLPLGAGSPEK
jgi:hypothetical protein